MDKVAEDLGWELPTSIIFLYLKPIQDKDAGFQDCDEVLLL